MIAIVVSIRGVIFIGIECSFLILVDRFKEV